MKNTIFPGRESAPWLVVPAVMAGITLGMFVYGYWLVDMFAPASRWLVPLIALVVGVGSFVYFLLFARLKNAGNTFPVAQWMRIAVSSLLAGTFLFFAATDRWQDPDRYAVLFLPDHTLELSVTSDQAPGDVSLLWFNTSLGDVSFDRLEYTGWERQDDRLVLTDPVNNQLLWTGKTGAQAQVLLQSEAGEADVILSWDGQTETIAFTSRKTTLFRSFAIPFHASRGMILLLGALNASLLCLPLCHWLFAQWGRVRPSMERVLAGADRKLNRNDGLVIVLVMTLAFLLRVINLENLFPGVEEYNHLLAAKQILQGTPITDVYQRSLWTVTLPVTWAFRVLGVELWSARLVGVVFNVLAILPLYLVARKIARPVALLSILLFATSPWVIAVSRVVREYGYYPFYYYWTFYIMVLFLERLLDQITLRRDWRVLTRPALLGLAPLLLLPVLYALVVDRTSTFVLILIAYAAFTLLAFIKMGLANGRNLAVFLFVAVLVVAGLALRYQRMPVSLGFTPAVLGYFFSNPPQQWYFGRMALVTLAGVMGSVWLGFWVRRSNFIPLFLLTVFGGFLCAFLFSTVNSFGARHVSTTQLWFIPLVALGLYVTWEFLKTLPLSTGSRTLLVLLLALTTFNIQQTLLPITSRAPGMVITEEFHRDLSRVQAHLLSKMREGDALISSRIYTRYVDWVDEPVFRAEYLFEITTTYADLSAFMDQYDSGWIVIDKSRLDSAAFPVSDTLSGDGRITFVGEFDDELVWRWGVQ